MVFVLLPDMISSWFEIHQKDTRFAEVSPPRWYIAGENGWHIFGENGRHIFGENRWYTFAENLWYNIAENTWYIIGRKMTERSRGFF